ncbi:TPA: hypothetical protein G9F27_005191 [Salmonella enterica]|uniref:Uncharacterized protein n=1 Tax=Salmonella enterica TaxID=28901 RepID=A0A743SSF8_SALER|nr:hypothetical protein [Salmonella enterica]
MDTRTITLTTQWQKVSEDAKSVVLQLMSGDAAFCFSLTKPADDADYHIMPHLELMTVTPPTCVWVRSTHIYKKDTFLTVSTVE